MTTILILNAVSSVLAAAGLGGMVVRARRRQATVQPVYVTTGRGRCR
jgi:hypothetical protein